MSARNRNNLPTNLAQLQNLIKRDAESYKDEFAQQWRHFQSNLELFALDPSQPNESVADLTMFIAQVADRYDEASTEFPEKVIDLLATNYLAMNPELRMTICKALILLRNKNLASPMEVLELFFKLLNAPDKLLRSTLYTHIVNDIKNVNAKHKNNKINTTLQNYMFSMLNDSSAIAAKTSIDIMIQLYRKNVWNDTKTVNVIVTACYSKIMKVKVAALKFFLGSDAPEENEDSGNDSDSDDDQEKARKLLVANQVSKKSGKKVKKLEKALSLLRKSKKKHKPVSFNFSAIHLINDPQGFAEKLFKEIERSNDRFEVKLMAMNLIGRLVGIHELVLLNFYPFLQRFLQPHQREVTKLLMIAAQATHDMVPPDVIELVIRTIANNFVSEKNSNEVMAVGLNAIREICNRNSNAMSEELLTDLVQYKTTKSKTVMMAARSLMQLYRNVDPTLLRKKDRGRPQEKDSTDLETNKAFGESKAVSFVPGADLLEPKKIINEDGEEVVEEDNEEEWETDEEEEDSDDDGWINISHSEDEAQSDDEGVEDDEEGEEQGEEEEVDHKKKAEEISTTKFLTDQDFKKIKMQSMSQKLNPKNKGRKRKSMDISEYIAEKSEVVSLDKIENVCKKMRHDKESRLATVYAGREGREKFGKPKDKRQNSHASTTNKEKLKNKPFMMVSKKYRSKTKKSFREKQIALRDSMLKREKNSR